MPAKFASMKRLACLALLLPLAAMAADHRVETIAEGLDHPWSLAFLPTGAMLVTERPGRLRVIDAGGLRAEAVAGVPAVFAGGQAGLFDVLVDRDDPRTLYLSYAEGSDAANHLAVARARFDGDALHEVAVLFRAQPDKRGSAHFGGRLVQLPDGSLVATVGDGFIHREDAQRAASHFGKLVRFGRDGGGLRIHSSGHRNPQGLVHDAATGTLYEHEHGPRGGDEINVIVEGGNHGWPLATHGLDDTGARVTPFTEYAGTRAPLLHWTPSIAPSGMALWRGDLYVGALVEKSLRRVELPSLRQTVLFAELGERIRDVRVGPEDALYLVTDSARGRVLKVVAGDSTSSP